MEYQELTAKYRPKKLEQMAGLDEQTKQQLSKIFSKKLPNAMMFAGPSGTGKTTLGRMAALYANCETRNVCGQCASCQQYIHPDILEVNAANTRGIDDMRSLLDQTKYSPSYRHRVVILDEAHQLTPQASQLLLKPCEDNKKALTFIFCTTDPQKLPTALKGRCTQFHLSQIGADEMSAYLHKLWKREAKLRKIVGVDPLPTIQLLAGSSNGQMRDAVKNLELALMAAEQGTLDAKQLKQQVFQQLYVGIDRAAVKTVYNLLLGHIERAASAVFDAPEGQGRQYGQKVRYLLENLLLTKINREPRFQDIAYKEAKALLDKKGAEYEATDCLRILTAFASAETSIISSGVTERHALLAAVYKSQK